MMANYVLLIMRCRIRIIYDANIAPPLKLVLITHLRTHKVYRRGNSVLTVS